MLGVVTNEMPVEAAIITEESNNIIRNSTKRCSLTLSSCKNAREIPLKFVTPHMNNSNNKPQKVAVIRSGECSPYPEPHLCAGVTF
ncbi:hypothetical protein ACNKHR_12460 [Shigella flexneri]